MPGSGTIGEVGVASPPWMLIAHAYLDKKIHEVRGGEHPDILKFFREIKHPEMNEDEIPWCAAFVGACCYEANQGHDGSAWAAHYGEWDKDVTRDGKLIVAGADRIWAPGDGAAGRAKCQHGDIMVLTRNGGGHVTFLEKDNDNGTFQGLGGNQSDAVTISTQSWNQVQFVMRPNGKGMPKLTEEDAKNTPLSLPEIGVGVGVGVTAFSTVDWMTALVVCAIIAAIGYWVWKKRQKA